MAVRINLLRDEQDFSISISRAFGAEGAKRTRSRILRRDWRSRNRDKDRAAALRWARKFPERAAARGRRNYEANRERAIEQSRKWQRDNAVRRNAYNATRRKAYVKRIPGWVTKEEIKAAYMQRSAGYEMDHIYPLTADWVSGLHCPANLRVLAESDNIRKFNRFSPALHLNQELPRSLYGYPARRMLTLSIEHIRLVYKKAFYVGP